MNKDKIDSFINRYSLDKQIESVLYKSNGSTLSVDIISDDKTLLGMVNVKDTNFPEGEFGVYTTSQLKSFLSVMGSDVEVEESPTALMFSDGKVNIQYMLAQKDVIPKVPDLKQLPDFDIEIDLDPSFVNSFVKSKGAIESDVFTFLTKGGKSYVVLGFSSINSNRISLEVKTNDVGEVKPISFSANYLKSILSANKDSKKGSMKISTSGLCTVEFESDDWESKYFLVEIK